MSLNISIHKLHSAPLTSRNIVLKKYFRQTVIFIYFSQVVSSK